MPWGCDIETMPDNSNNHALKRWTIVKEKGRQEKGASRKRGERVRKTKIKS